MIRLCSVDNARTWFVNEYPDIEPDKFRMIGGRDDDWTVEEIEQQWGEITWYRITPYRPRSERP